MHVGALIHLFYFKHLHQDEMNFPGKKMHGFPCSLLDSEGLTQLHSKCGFCTEQSHPGHSLKSYFQHKLTKFT